MKMLWRLLLFLPLILCQDSPCPASSPCTFSESCPWYREFVSLLKTNRDEYRKRINTVKELICNQSERKICCEDGNTESTEDDTDSLKEDGIQHSGHTSPGWIPLASKGECGEDDSAFILGGENTKLGEMPWTALLGAPRKRDRKFKWKCGGAVINKWYVLTAAHCDPVTTVRLGEWRVVTTDVPNTEVGIVFSEAQREECGASCWNYALADGTRDCASGGTRFRFATEGTRAHCGPSYQDFRVENFIIHPRYRILPSGVVIYDLALIKLSRPTILIGEGDSLVSPICLPPPGNELLEEEEGEGIVIGWGATKTQGTVTSLRQKKLKMPLVNNTECGNLMSNLFNVNIQADMTQQHHLCAGAVAGKDTCRGDSGGPFIVRKNSNSPYTLAGVVSFGSSRCGIGSPAVFARVKTYLQWIKDNLV